MPAPVYSLTVDEPTTLGYKWSLAVAGKRVAGGITPTMWQALDNSNDALHDLFYSPLGAYYRSTIGMK